MRIVIDTPTRAAKADAMIQEKDLMDFEEVPLASRTFASLPEILICKPRRECFKITIVKKESARQMTLLIILTWPGEKTNSFENKIPLLEKMTDDKRETKAVEKIFKLKLTKNILAFKEEAIFSVRKTKRLHAKTESKTEGKIIPLLTVKVKNKNPPKFIMPSKKIAIRPAYSEIKAPIVKSKRGEAM